MALTIYNLKNDRRSTSVDYGTEKVEFVYKPGEVTPELGAAMTAPDNRMPLVMALGKVLDSWNVLDDATGKPAPITEELLSGLPTMFLNALLGAIYKDIQPGKR